MSNKDRLSNLPDDIAHKVVFLLDSMEDRSRLSVVSKRWRQLCITTSFLALDDFSYRNNDTKRARLMNYIDRLLFLRKGNKIQDFRIRWSLQTNKKKNRKEEEGQLYFRVLSWLINVLECNVETLVVIIDLPNKMGSNFALPWNLLCCQSLKSLSLTFNNGVGFLKTPSSSSSSINGSSLKSIVLKNVRIDNDESFGSWVSCYCKKLEQLSLVEIKGIKSLFINSSSLKILDIVRPGQSLNHLHVNSNTLEVMSLVWLTDSLNYRGVDIAVSQFKHVFSLGNYVDFFHSWKPKFVYFREYRTSLQPSSFAKEKLVSILLHSDPNKIELLRLYYDTVQALLNQLAIGRFESITLPNLISLDIQMITSSTACEDLLPMLASFLKRTPNLKHLSVRRRDTQRFHANAREGEDVETIKNLELLNSESMPINLKLVKLNLVTLRKKELEPIKYFLKYANNLRIMVIYYSPQYLTLDVIRREITGYEKASSNAEVVFKECGVCGV